MKNFLLMSFLFISAFIVKVYAQNKDIICSNPFSMGLNIKNGDSITINELSNLLDNQNYIHILRSTDINLNGILYSNMTYMNKHFKKPLKNFGVSFLKAVSDTCIVIRILGNLSENSFHPNRFLFGCVIVEDYKFYIYNDCNMDLSKIFIPQKEMIKLSSNEDIPSLVETQVWFYHYTPNQVWLIKDNLGRSYGNSCYP